MLVVFRKASVKYAVKTVSSVSSFNTVTARRLQDVVFYRM